MTGVAQTEILPEEVDIAIVGTGLTGLCLALFLAQKQSSWNILLLPRGRSDTESRVDGEQSLDHRQIALAESSRRLFHAIGLWSEIEKHAAAIAEIHVSDRGQPGHSQLIAEEQGLDAYGYVIDSAKLSSLLLTALEYHTNVRQIADPVEDGLTPPTSNSITLLPKKDCMVLRVGDSSIRSELTILANGKAPFEAQSLGLQFKRKDYGHLALTAEVTLDSAHEGVAYERFTKEGPIALLPIPDRDGLSRAGLIWTLSAEQAEQLFAAEDSLFIDELQQSFGDRAGAIVSVAHRALVPLSRTIAAEQVRSHLVLMGTAAHSLHPVAGQGFNLTLRDIAGLGEVLTKAKVSGTNLGDLATLQCYEKSRVVDQQQVVGFSDVLPGLFASENPLLSVGRNLGLLGLDLVPGLRNAVARFGAGLTTREAQING
jgi:2-octaprenyl-6-methoxyphenol hydroxylase